MKSYTGKQLKEMYPNCKEVVDLEDNAKYDFKFRFSFVDKDGNSHCEWVMTPEEIETNNKLLNDIESGSSQLAMGGHGNPYVPSALNVNIGKLDEKYLIR